MNKYLIYIRNIFNYDRLEYEKFIEDYQKKKYDKNQIIDFAKKI